MKYFKIYLILFFSTFSIFAQNKNFTIEDIVLNSYRTLAVERLNQLSWIPNSEFLSFVEGDTLFKVNPRNNKKTELLNLTQLNKITEDANLDSKNSRFPRIVWIDENTISFWKDSNYIHLDLLTPKAELMIKTTSLANNKKLSTNNKSVAYTIENNLYLANGIDNVKQITFEENLGIVSGQSVSRNEFGISGGIFWSPKSNYLAFYQKDETGVTDFPLVEIGTAPAKLNNIKYPMAGQTSEIIKVGVYDISNNKTIWLKTGEPNDHYLTNLTWDPSEKFIYIAHLNRDQNHMRLIKYDAINGEPVKVLFEEKDEEYVEPENELQFICEDEDKFIWFSERDDWQHLYLYNTDGKLIKQITSGEWIVKSIKGFNKSKKELFFIGTKDSPIEDHLYKVNLENWQIDRITKPDFNHSVIINEYSNLILDSYSNFDVPFVTQVIDSKGNEIIELIRSKNPLADYSISKPKIFKLKGENNVDLYSRIILPANFDSTKTYPVIVYVYGGPHAQLVTNNWYAGRYDFWFQYMAQNGYLVFTLDNRGSSNRGLEFEQAIFGKLGTKEIEDQLVGVEYLKSLSYVDSNRIGVFGWSYGGFMTTALMLRTNDAFKVGVGGGAVIDWKLYEVMYGERYMDSPQDNPDGYKEANLLNYVENLNGKLLLVHGTSDPVVVWEHTLEFAKKAANLNKALDYFPYVGHGHGVGGKDAIHLYQKISNYFLENL